MGLLVVMASLLGRAATGPEGVALMIVYDTSGSMQQSVRDREGNLTPKHVIAKRSLDATLDRLEVAAGPGGERVPMEVGFIVFQGDHAEVGVKLGPFRPQAIREYVRLHGKPQRGTPLGDAVRLAGEAVLDSKQPRKHVLVITDGVNTKGPKPTVTMPEIQLEAGRRQRVVSFHFVAFDVNAAEFDGVKNQGATVLGANDEKQLNTQLEFILAKKILLEDEDVPSTKPKPN
jgi:hypothetical protein